ncbi:recombinase family protein [Mycobacterium sp. URHD0025]|uniref:recombinase family protein n=1 Tax=Mycobacterium sp. URHD0025 TaxID=1298864 RepID=UPI0004200016|nr:recombinase family protein [Mycobacterium sp. URHD0025]
MSAIFTAPGRTVRAGCYLRISSDPRDKRAGVTRQREDTAVLCEVNGWTPVDVYADNDKSATSGGPRPEWDRLLADVKGGRLDGIVVWNQDRGWRTMADLESLRPVLQPRGVLLATTNIGVIDFANADDVFRAQVSTAISEMEVAKMRVRMRRAARQKAELGMPKWRKAFGYLPYTGTKEADTGVREPDPMTAPLVLAAYKMVLNGCSMVDIARMFNDAEAFGLTGKPWTHSTVSLFLRKARNAGLREHNGEVVGPGTWPALVPENTWRSVQTILNADSRKPGTKAIRRHLLTGLLNCERCGHHLSGQWVIRATGNAPGRPKAGETKPLKTNRERSITYSCAGCRGVSIRARHIEPLTFELVAGRLAKPDAVDLLKAPEFDEEKAERLRTERQTLLARRGEIADERADGLLDKAAYHRMIDRIDRKVEAIDAEQVDSDKARIFDGLPLGTPQVREAVEELSPDRYRAVIEVLLNLTIKPVGRSHRPSATERFDPERVGVVWR